MAVREGQRPTSSGMSPLGVFAMGLLIGAIIITIPAVLVSQSEYKKWHSQIAVYEQKIKDYSEELASIEESLKKKAVSVTPMILKLRPQLDPIVAEEISKAVGKYSQEYRIPPQFIVHIINRESTFNTLAVSSAGAVGLMQVLPKYHKDKMEKIGITHDQLFHIDPNIRLGCKILRDYYNETGSIDKALTKYVGGNHKTYIEDILEGFANEMIPRKEPVKKE